MALKIKHYIKERTTQNGNNGFTIVTDNTSTNEKKSVECDVLPSSRWVTYLFKNSDGEFESSLKEYEQNCAIFQGH